MARVLVVEDVLEVRDLVVARLKRDGHEVICSSADPKVAVERALAFAPDIGVVDVALPHRTGLRALRALRAVDPDLHLIACTRAGEDVNVIDAIRGGASQMVSTLHALQIAVASHDRRRAAPRDADLTLTS